MLFVAIETEIEQKCTKNLSVTEERKTTIGKSPVWNLKKKTEMAVAVDLNSRQTA